MNKTTSIFLAALLATGLFLSSCSSPKPTPEAEEVSGEVATPEELRLSPEAVRRAGLQTLTIQERALENRIATTAEIQADENRVFRINSFAAGRISQDNVRLGDTIRQGQTLAVVQNLDVAKIQAQYIHELHQNEIDIAQAKDRLALAQRNLARERRLLNEGISPRKDYYQAETDASLAKTQYEGQLEHQVHIKAEGKALLGAYGMRPGGVHSETIRTGTPVSAPRAGIVTKKNITLGDVVTSDTTLYEVADLSRVWLNVTVYPQNLNTVALGQAVVFSPDTLPGKRFTGKINYLPPSASEQSQTFIARAFLDNPQGLLKPGMFGQATIEQPGGQTKPYLPEEALQKYGKEAFVFRVLAPGHYQKQTVRLGAKSGNGYWVESGIQPGETVVGKGSFTLKAELLKSQFAEEEE